uniref:Phenol 2-monooxygenase n=1 Tax=Moniliophthora roreri TaxID=221103 RepID=A0A0W0G6V4_MONRR
MSSTKETSVDVLVIGAGPAGLMCAFGLARAGVNQQRPIKVAAGQADGIQPRTIEVFQSYGLAERLLKEGNQMHMAAFYGPDSEGGIELIERVPDVTAPSARYPFEVTLHQGAIEAIFLDNMRAMGVQVDRPIVPTSIQISDNPSVLEDPESYPVRVELQHLQGEANTTEVVHAKYVIGADGAHSWVRRTLGIVMEGEHTDYIWGVIDMVPDTDFPDVRNKTAVHSNNGSCMIIPREEDKIRVYIQLEECDAVDSASKRVDKSKMGPERLLEVAQKSFHPYIFRKPQDFDWWTLYIIGQRVASQFSVKDRVFIVGDACHTHSPKAGQGMNASMNDSYNLVWKLAHVLRGWASRSLLQTYELERRRYANQLINFDKKFAKLFSGKPRSDLNMNGVSHEEFLQAFQTFGGFTSGIGVHYENSAIVDARNQSFAASLTVGERILPHVLLRAADSRPFNIQDLLPSDTRFKILVFTGDSSDTKQLARVQSLAECLQAPESFLVKGSAKEMIEIISISSTKKKNVVYNVIPLLFRSHWSKVFIDDVDQTGKQGGGLYSSYGIGPEGAVVVVRPDGYVGTITSLEGAEDLTAYFARFTS